MNLSGCSPLLLATLHDLWMPFAQCHHLSHSWWYQPLHTLTGQVPDISFLLHFTFWEPVCYKVDQSETDSHFPSHSNEKCGQCIGFAEDRGDQFTGKILTDDTQKVLIWSSACSAIHTSTKKRLTLSHGEGQKIDLTSDSIVHDTTSSHEDSGLMPTINFNELLGRTFLLAAQENGECR